MRAKRLFFYIAIFLGLVIPAVILAATADPVAITGSGLTGYIFSEQYGWIHLAPTLGASTTWDGVLNDGAGNLSGYAFGTATSWINFDPASSTSAAFDSHGVQIDSTTGEFSGWAWVQNTGWMLFDCSLTDGISSPCVKNDGGTVDPVDRISWLCASEPGNTDCHDHTRVNWNIQTATSTSGGSGGGGGGGSGGGGGGSTIVGMPIATPAAGTYSSSQSVTLTSATSTSIHYTTDGTAASCSSGLTYSSAISVSLSESINAIGCNGSYFSSVGTFNYTISVPIVVGDPVASPGAGTYTATTTVTLTSASSTSISYTNDGTDPTCSGYGTSYSSPIIIGSSETIKAIGCNGMYTSGVITFNYTINLPIIPPTVYAPQASLPSGTYSGPQNVSLSSLNSTSIYYTTNGDTPDCSGAYNIYTSEIVVSSSETIKAIGCSGVSYSSISEFDYIINPVAIITTATTTLGNGSLEATTTGTTSTNSGTTTVTSLITNTLATIGTSTTESINKIVDVTNAKLKNVSVLAKKIFAAPENIKKVQAVTTIGVVAGTAVSAVSGIMLSTFSFADLALLPLRLWAFILGLLGLSKRKKPWGTVYDSVTKQPLDPVYVVLRSIEGIDVATAITDLDGRYGFVAPKSGNYSIVVNKTNYQFPSQKLVGRDHDELYRDLYFGEHFSIANIGEVITKNIPMDPEKFDWNEFAKKSQHLMKFYSSREKWFSRISGFFFYIGFIVSALAVSFLPTQGNIIIFVLYIALFFVRAFGLKSRPYGSVVDTEGKPIAFAIIRVSHIETGVEIMHRITDAIGRYYCLLPNGNYFVRVDRKLSDGSYQKIVEKLTVTVTKGYLSEKISVPSFSIDLTPPPAPVVPVVTIAPKTIQAKPIRKG